jgi:hypothetical protein
MLRPLFALAAFALTASPAIAGTYSAKTADPASGRYITRDITWNCSPDACQGSTEESRPAVLCQSLAKRAGRIESFIANGRAFTAAELDKCNASARIQKSAALAAQ